MAVYKRLDTEEAKRLRRCYYEDQLFNVLGPVLKHYGEGERELSAVELWTEALGLAGELARSPRPDKEIEYIVAEMSGIYVCLSDNPECRRSDEEAGRTVFLILMTVLYMMHAPMIGQTEKEHSDMIDNLAKIVACHPLRKDFMYRVQLAEDLEEKKNRFVTACDYLREGMVNDVCDHKEECVQLVKDFVDSVKKHGDMDTSKEVKGALHDFNMEQDHLYDEVLMDFSQWMIEKNNEYKGNTFNGAVGAVGCSVDRQIFSQLTQKGNLS